MLVVLLCKGPGNKDWLGRTYQEVGNWETCARLICISCNRPHKIKCDTDCSDTDCSDTHCSDTGTEAQGLRGKAPGNISGLVLVCEVLFVPKSLKVS